MSGTVRRRLCGLVTAVSLGLLCATTGSSGAAASSSTTGEHVLDGVRLNSFEARLVADMNQARVAHGLHPLRVVAGTTDVARRWSWHLALIEQLVHNPKLTSDVSHAGSAAWTSVAENVGYGPVADPDTLFQAYMHSPEHRANILRKSVTDVGVGVVMRGDTAWNTVDFVNAYKSSYGSTRVPADGLPQDALTVAATTRLGTVTHVDQHFGPFSFGKVKASRLRYSSNQVRTTLSSRRTTGRGGILFREPLVLTPVQRLTMTLATADAKKTAVPVTVTIGNGWQSAVAGTFLVLGSRTITVAVPASLRSFANTVTLSIPASRVVKAGHRVKLSVANLNAVV